MGKTYVVFVGREPGIYDTWGEASSKVTGHKGVVHQSFKNRDEAERVYDAFMVKQAAGTSSNSSANESSSSSTFSSSNTRGKVSQTEQIKKLQGIEQNVDEKKKNLEAIVENLKSLQISDHD